MSKEEESAADTPAAMDDIQVSRPPTPPTPDLETNESKVSRKREREVSLEPATPQATTVEFEPERPDTKERRTPAKKNRVSAALDATEEQDEDVELDIEVAFVSGSPPHESKISQISQGVEDLTWKRKERATQDFTEGQDENLEFQRDPMSSSEPQTEPETESQPELVIPPHMQGENPPLVYDAIDQGDEHAGAADPPEEPPTAEPELPSVDPATAPAPAYLSRISPPPGERDSSDSDPDQDKGTKLKRKFGDRTVSEQHMPGHTKTGSVAGKRSRDDEDEVDANPREPKRPTPPPEEDEQEGKKGTKSPRKLSKERLGASTSSSASPSASAGSSTSKLGGFMAYASSSSPFAKVAGPSVFGQTRGPSSSWDASSTAPPAPSLTGSASTADIHSPSPSQNGSPLASTSQTPTSSQSVTPAPALSSTPHKPTGFEAFAGVSPFASAAKRSRSPPAGGLFGSRNQSPARMNAFSAYVGAGAYGFAGADRGASVPSTGAELGVSQNGKRKSEENGAAAEGDEEEEDAEKEKEEKRSSFGDKLRASKDQESEEGSDEERATKLTEQEVVTGEEDDDTIYQVRGKLYALSDQNQWRERGTGTLRLNVRRSDGAGARLVMRKEAVYTVLLNATLFKGMRVFLAQDPRYLRFSVLESGATTHYNLRLSTAKIAAELLQEINSHIPGA